ncbi:MAG TPA: DUF6056 family protein, partial [Chitinophagales bacterium]|nr:DUF6056 family protein [Chitinophagales bacterium]
KHCMAHEKRNKWLVVGAGVLLLIPYLYISIYANPVADDLTYSADGKNSNLLTLLIRDYYGWNGRYASNIFVFNNPMVYNSLIVYKLMPVLIIVLMLISNFIFIRELLNRELDKADEMLISLLLTLLFLHQMPIPSEGIYWFTGAVTYQLATIFTVVYFSFLLMYIHKRILLKSRIIHLFILFFFLVSSIGFNEVHMIALLSFASISLFIVWKNKLEWQRLFTALFIITLLSAAAMFFAPGNEVRASLAPGNHRFFPSLLFSLIQTLRFFLEWSSSLPLLISSVFYYFLHKKIAHIRLFSVSFYLKPFYSGLLLFFVIFIAVFPPYWSTGILGQHRTLNVAYYFFLLAWFINLSVFFNWCETKLLAIRIWNNQLKIGLIIILLFSLFFTKNEYHILNDLFYHRAAFFDLQMKKRYELMHTTKDTIFFSPIIDPPKTLFMYDVTANPDDWQNKSYTIYFNCREKVLVKK